MRTFVVGDLHGSYSKLMTALDVAGFSDEDTLYCTGDICDRGNEILETINFVLDLDDRFKSVFGNHDVWAYHYLIGDICRDAMDCWKHNGGSNTIKAFKQLDDKETVIKFYKKMPYRIKTDKFDIMHTTASSEFWEGVNIDEITLKNAMDILVDPVYDCGIFDRTILKKAIMGYTPYAKNGEGYFGEKMIIIGHTPQKIRSIYAPKFNLLCIDTAGFCTKSTYGFDGKITLFEPDAEKFFDSDKDIYILDDIKVGIE